MRRNIKRIFGLRLLLFVIGFTILMSCSGANRALAEVQKKNPYLIKVNRVYNTITVYELDEGGRYSKPIKVMLCSVGAKGQTKVGTFHTKEKYRWKLLMGDVWGQYSTRVVDGILFHSVYYYKKCNPSSLATKEYNKLGTAASHGCIRLSVIDAKWIYDNCPIGTTVIVYDDKKSPGPLGKPEAIQISSDIRWDPTDPNSKNPYNDKKPVITGVKSTKIAWGKEIDLLKGVKAKSSLGTDITSDVTVMGKINPGLPGNYKITYSVTDALGKKTAKAITVTVKKNTALPKLKGIKDKVIGSGVTIDEKFALSGVEAYCSGIKLDKNTIEVTIDKISEEEYYIIYRVSAGKGPVATKKSKVLIDGQAPVFAGIANKTLEIGELPGTVFLLEGVTVSDNYTVLENIKVSAEFSENPDGTYTVTYKAVDEVGNEAIEYATINH